MKKYKIKIKDKKVITSNTLESWQKDGFKNTEDKTLNKSWLQAKNFLWTCSNMV